MVATCLLLLLLPVCGGCGLWYKVRDRAAQDRRQLMEALAPLADPNGGAFDERARGVEERMSGKSSPRP